MKVAWSNRKWFSTLSDAKIAQENFLKSTMFQKMYKVFVAGWIHGHFCHHEKLFKYKYILKIKYIMS